MGRDAHVVAERRAHGAQCAREGARRRVLRRCHHLEVEVAHVRPALLRDDPQTIAAALLVQHGCYERAVSGVHVAASGLDSDGVVEAATCVQPFGRRRRRVAGSVAQGARGTGVARAAG